MASVKPISTIRAAFPSSDVLFSLAVDNVVVVVVVVVVAVGGGVAVVHNVAAHSHPPAVKLQKPYANVHKAARVNKRQVKRGKSKLSVRQVSQRDGGDAEPTF